MVSVEILPNILKNLHQFYTISSKKQNRREHFSTHSVRPVLLRAKPKAELQANIDREFTCKNP